MKKISAKGDSTKNIHSGNDPEFPVGAINTPIYASSTFVFPDVATGANRFAFKEDGTIYSRWGNPTVSALETKLAQMEKAGGAIALASGMNAITSLFYHYLSQGSEVIAHSALYGGTFQYLSNMITKFGVKVHFMNFQNLAEVEKIINKNTKILYFETPTNPLMQVVDIQAVARLGKKHKVLVAMDNTFAPPPIQRPISLGVDIVVHSLTKYINGHSDIIGGAIIGSHKNIDAIRKQTTFFLGGTMSPFTAFLVSRGMTTLTMRLQKHSTSAMKVAKFLENHKKVEMVYYPGLPTHKNHNVAKKQMRGGYGGVLSFILKGGFNKGRSLMEQVDLIKLAVSLGGVDSLIEHPASMTHSEYSQKDREKAGIYDGLVRLAVGLEDVEDIIDDLDQALKKI